MRVSVSGAHVGVVQLRPLFLARSLGAARGGLAVLVALPRAGVPLRRRRSRGRPQVGGRGAPGRLTAKQLDGQPLKGKEGSDATAEDGGRWGGRGGGSAAAAWGRYLLQVVDLLDVAALGRLQLADVPELIPALLEEGRGANLVAADRWETLCQSPGPACISAGPCRAGPTHRRTSVSVCMFR